MQHPFFRGQKFLVMAHRGGEGQWPSNTLYAYQQAVSLGADVLELDIHLTADQAIVVRHDPIVDSTTNGAGKIQDLSLAEIKPLDAGYNWSTDGGLTYPYRNLGITIPTLEEVLEAFPGVRLNIDIKPQDPAIIAPFARLLRRFNKLEQVIVGSFHDDQLRRFRSLCPATATAAGVRDTRWFYGLSLVRLGFFYRSHACAFQVPEYAERMRLVTPRFIQDAHAHRMQVHVWTINEVVDMQRLIEWGVDGLFTDYPERLIGLLKRITSPSLVAP